MEDMNSNMGTSRSITAASRLKGEISVVCKRSCQVQYDMFIHALLLIYCNLCFF